MEPHSAALSLPWSGPQHTASSTSTISAVSNSSAVSSRLSCSANSCGTSATSDSRPVVVSSDSGIFTDVFTSASEHQTGDTHASRSSSSQSVDRLDSSCVDRTDSAAVQWSDRPMSALARGVQIIEYHRWNPKPVPSANEESLVLMEEYLCPRKLVSVKLEKYVRIVLHNPNPDL